MPVLHTINTFSDQYAAFRDCVPTLEQNDAVVFMEEAAENLDVSDLPDYQKLLSVQCAVYILPFDDHTPLRSEMTDPIEVLSYSDFVDLCCRFSKIQNWY